MVILYTNSFRILISILTRAPSTNDVTMTAESSPPLMTRERFTIAATHSTGAMCSLQEYDVTKKRYIESTAEQVKHFFNSPKMQIKIIY